MSRNGIIPLEYIARKIFLIRGIKVMLDSDLADLYKVPTKVLNQAIKRNLERFPEDFMFQLSEKEFESLRSQIVTSNIRAFITASKKHSGGRRYLPYAFSEQGVAMLSSVLRSKKAIQINIQIMRTFAKLHEILFSYKAIAGKMEELEKKCDAKFKIVFETLRELLSIPEKTSHQIGFYREE